MSEEPGLRVLVEFPCSACISVLPSRQIRCGFAGILYFLVYLL